MQPLHLVTHLFIATYVLWLATETLSTDTVKGINVIRLDIHTVLYTSMFSLSLCLSHRSLSLPLCSSFSLCSFSSLTHVLHASLPTTCNLCDRVIKFFQLSKDLCTKFRQAGESMRPFLQHTNKVNTFVRPHPYQYRSPWGSKHSSCSLHLWARMVRVWIKWRGMKGLLIEQRETGKESV